MKTVLYGNVTQEHIDSASLFSGIEPTSYVTNGKHTPPASQLETEVIPQCPMVPGEPGERQNHWRLASFAEAAIFVDPPEHLVSVLQRLDALIYEV